MGPLTLFITEAPVVGQFDLIVQFEVMHVCNYGIRDTSFGWRSAGKAQASQWQAIMSTSTNLARAKC